VSNCEELVGGYSQEMTVGIMSLLNGSL